MKPLRIGIIAPPWFAVPPTGYGGIELVVAQLADGLADRGHDVTLFASGGSSTRARLESVFSEPPSAMLGSVAVEATHLIHAYARSDDFDIVHDHTLSGLIAGANSPVPVVHTIHGPINEEFATLYGTVADRVSLVAISEAQRRMLPHGAPATVIHNGIDTRGIPFRSSPGTHLLFCGRVNEEKGLVDAIEIARRSRRPLKLVVKINEAPEHAYWQNVVLPRLQGLDVEVFEQPPTQRKFELYRDAYATLFPIRWPEPFGLVMIESLATGTPVIAFNAGSVPEVIDDGITGYICDSLDEAVERVDRITTLDRRKCRAAVEMRFNAALNVLRHERLYQRVVTNRRTAGVVPGHEATPATLPAALPTGAPDLRGG